MAVPGKAHSYLLPDMHENRIIHIRAKGGESMILKIRKMKKSLCVTFK